MRFGLSEPESWSWTEKPHFSRARPSATATSRSPGPSAERVGFRESIWTSARVSATASPSTTSYFRFDFAAGFFAAGFFGAAFIAGAFFAGAAFFAAGFAAGFDAFAAGFAGACVVCAACDVLDGFIGADAVFGGGGGGAAFRLG